MKLHNVTKRLIHKGFIHWDLNEFKTAYEKLCGSNIQVWRHERRVIVIKSYSSKPYFSSWLDDQIQISFIYDILETKAKNNLYYLIILSWDVELDSDLVESINQAEKNELVCRKYVIFRDEDLERVPFLQENELFNRNISINYEQEFKDKLSPKVKYQKLIANYFLPEDYFAEDKSKRYERIQKLIYEGEEI